MRIKLEYLLNKKMIGLKYFCDLNDIDSYESLCTYCDEKDMIPPDQEFYIASMPSKNTAKKEVNETPKKKPATTRRSRKTSKVTKKRTASSKDNP